MRLTSQGWAGGLRRLSARLGGALRVLHVIHRLDTHGGIESHTRAMVEELKDDVTSTIVLPRSPNGPADEIADEQVASHLRVVRLKVDRGGIGLRVLGFPSEVSDPAVDDAFRRLLGDGYDVVHFQSLVGWNTLQLPRIAHEAGTRVVISAHDLSWLCADFNMMLERTDRPCGRNAAHGSDPGCVQCLTGKTAPTPANAPLARYMDDRYAAARAALALADAVVCPSSFALNRLRHAFGNICEERLVLMPHGVREYRTMLSHSRGATLRVAFLGRFCDRKGADVLLAVARNLIGIPIAFEVWGPVEDRVLEPALAAGIRLRGEYAPHDLEEGLRGIDLVLVPSVMEESFCLVVSEAQRLGIPVAASRGGAIPERIREGETGFLFPVGDPQAIGRLLLALLADRSALENVAARLREGRPKTSAQNAGEYLRLYASLCAPPPYFLWH
jgi:glycosyltransferase involved in cell wall biosynthesis